MQIFYSFLLVGAICAVASLIYDLTKFTPGHITSMFVVLGSFLGVFGFYDELVDKFGYGLNLPITSFGNMLVKAAYEGAEKYGFYGIFSNMLSTTSAGITAAIVFSLLMTLIAKPRD